MQENDNEENLEEVVNVDPPKSVDYDKLSKEKIVQLLKDAVAGGIVDAHDQVRLRAEMGIFNSHFTKKQTSDTKRKSKRVAQKAARKKQRKR